MRKSASISVVCVVVLAACARGDVGRGAVTTLTSGETNPSPPPQSRTVDNSGWVDPGGRTSDETRPETSGMRATELGADRPTGTNTGVPVGARTGEAPRSG